MKKIKEELFLENSEFNLFLLHKLQKLETKYTLLKNVILSNPELEKYFNSIVNSEESKETILNEVMEDYEKEAKKFFNSKKSSS